MSVVALVIAPSIALDIPSTDVDMNANTIEVTTTVDANVADAANYEEVSVTNENGSVTTTKTTTTTSEDGKTVVIEKEITEETAEAAI